MGQRGIFQVHSHLLFIIDLCLGMLCQWTSSIRPENLTLPKARRQALEWQTTLLSINILLFNQGMAHSVYISPRSHSETVNRHTMRGRSSYFRA
jgi:hypothetical protein